MFSFDRFSAASAFAAPSSSAPIHFSQFKFAHVAQFLSENLFTPRTYCCDAEMFQVLTRDVHTLQRQFFHVQLSLVRHLHSTPTIMFNLSESHRCLCFSDCSGELNAPSVPHLPLCSLLDLSQIASANIIPCNFAVRSAVTNIEPRQQEILRLRSTVT